MTHTNPRNLCTAIGRLVRKPTVRYHKDGSRKYLFILAVRRNFDNSKGKRDMDFICLEAYTPSNAGCLTSYDLIAQGDLLAVQYTVRTSVYINAAGLTQYGTSLFVQDIELLAQSASKQRQQAEAPEEEPGSQKADSDDQNIPDDLYFNDFDEACEGERASEDPFEAFEDFDGFVDLDYDYYRSRPEHEDLFDDFDGLSDSGDDDFPF